MNSFAQAANTADIIAKKCRLYASPADIVARNAKEGNGTNGMMDGKKPEFMPGVPPNLSNPPTGCRFASRCPQVMEKCSKDVPEFHTKSGFVKCWLYESL